MLGMTSKAMSVADDPRRARGERHLAHLGQQVGADRNAGLHPLRGDAALGIAGDHHRPRRIGRLGAAQRDAEDGVVGSVPSRDSALVVGATWTPLAEVVTMPISPCSTAISA